MSIDNKFEINVGLLAPSGAGKTSLIAAIYNETKQLLLGEDLRFAPSTPITRTAIDRSFNEFNACISVNDEDGFKIHGMKGTEDVTEFQFTFTFGKEKIRLNIMDYPGGVLGIEDEKGARVADFLRKCSVLLVPVSAEIVMDHHRTIGKNLMKARTFAAKQTLRLNNTKESMLDWILSRKEPAQLIFVPVKCEHCFTDQFQSTDSPKNRKLSENPREQRVLYESILEAYFDSSFKEKLKSQEIDISALPIRCGNVEVSIFPVDTYGVVELNDVNYDWDQENFHPQFRRRRQLGTNIKSRNAFEVLASIIEFRFRIYSLHIKQGLAEARSKMESLEKIATQAKQQEVKDLQYAANKRAEAEAAREAYEQMSTIGKWIDWFFGGEQQKTVTTTRNAADEAISNANYSRDIKIAKEQSAKQAQDEYASEESDFNSMAEAMLKLQSQRKQFEQRPTTFN